MLTQIMGVVQTYCLKVFIWFTVTVRITSVHTYNAYRVHIIFASFFVCVFLYGNGYFVEDYDLLTAV